MSTCIRGSEFLCLHVTPGFWSAFWAALFAAVVGAFVGAGLGLPVGLRLDRARRDREIADSDARRRDATGHALDVMRDAVNDNVETLRRLKTSLPDPDMIQLDTGLTVGTWEALRTDVLSGLRDEPELRADLADFFGQLGRLEALNALLRDYTIGVSAALGGAEGIREAVRSHAEARANLLIEKGERILNRMSQDRAARRQSEG